MPSGGRRGLNDLDGGAETEDVPAGSCWLCAGGKTSGPRIQGPLLSPPAAVLSGRRKRKRKEKRKTRNEADDSSVARLTRKVRRDGGRGNTSESRRVIRFITKR